MTLAYILIGLLIIDTIVKAINGRAKNYNDTISQYRKYSSSDHVHNVPTGNQARKDITRNH